MPRPKTTGAGRLRKMECPHCQFIAYCSRGAVIRHGLPLCSCGGQMHFRDLEDQLAAAYERAHEHPDFAAFVKREAESARRAASNVPAERLRCGGCNAWVSSTNAMHSCGFHNDIRGNRNHGRWVEGQSRVSSGMPF